MNTAKVSANKKDAAVSLGGLTLMCLFIFITNPKSLSVIFLLVLPLLIAITVFGIARILLRLVSSISETLGTAISLVAAAGILLLVLLSSLGQLGIQDGLLALLLVTGLIFYLRQWSARRFELVRD